MCERQRPPKQLQNFGKWPVGVQQTQISQSSRKSHRRFWTYSTSGSSVFKNFFSLHMMSRAGHFFPRWQK
jgi:hypothetical protein